MILELKDISKTFTEKGRRPVIALNTVNLAVAAGQRVGVVGESGCGKTTLMRIIAGILKPSSGEVLFQGKPLHVCNKADRQELQMVFQNSLDAVVPYWTAEQIIEEPLKNFYSLTRQQREKRVCELMNMVGLDPAERHKYPYQFSGGQLQRICIARALAPEPRLLLLDEPLSSLDVSVQAQILNLLRDLAKELNLTYLIISHDLEAVYYLSDALVVMYAGTIVEQTDKLSDLNDLRHPYTSRLLNASYGFRSNRTNTTDILDFDSGERTGCPYQNRCPLVDQLCRTETPRLRSIAEGHLIACHHV